MCAGAIDAGSPACISLKRLTKPCMAMVLGLGSGVLLFPSEELKKETYCYVYSLLKTCTKQDFEARRYSQRDGNDPDKIIKFPQI
jgi:hypothetical protein